MLLGRFRLQRLIGRGGMGEVFAASDLQMQGEPQIAVKLLNEDMRDFPVAAMALERECRKVRMLAHDAMVYCRGHKQRRPTEDEWEYVARGPDRHNFPWGDSVAPATRSSHNPPRASDGPAEGIGGHHRGLSGNVWQWVDTSSTGGTRILKGGSWLEANPANRRAAAQRLELPGRATRTAVFDVHVRSRLGQIPIHGCRVCDE